MAVNLRLLALLVASAAGACGGPPAELATALERLREQKSYSWEVINGDPGPVAQRIETRRGTLMTVQQSTLPNMRVQIDRQGAMRVEREWSDGFRLTTLMPADGSIVTLTPEGWLTDREILRAQAEERTRSRTPSPRYQWLRRADRPDVRRPDEELLPLLKSAEEFEFTGDSYIVRMRSRAGDPARPVEDETEPAINVTITMNLRSGIIRDYEVKVEGVRRTPRSRINVPASEQRLVVLTYLPVGSIDIPPEAAEKLAAARPAGGGASAAKGD